VPDRKLDTDEYQSIKSLEEELISSQILDLRIKSDDGRNPINRIIEKYAVTSSFYTKPEVLEIVIKKLEKVLEKYIEQAGIRGKILGKKALNKYLEKSEIADRTQRQLRAIDLSNESKARRRLGVVLLKLKREKNLLQADLNIFKKTAKLAGFTDKQITRQLILIGKEKAGVVKRFQDNMKKVAAAAVRNETNSREIDEYLKKYPKNKYWQWIAISANPCPDCTYRAGKSLQYSEWLKIGLPNTGRTICNRWGAYCRCKLIPDPIANKRFPTLKEFKFNKKNLVLTTTKEERIIDRAK